MGLFYIRFVVCLSLQNQLTTCLTPECEVSYEGGEDLEKLFNDCKTNAGHNSFVPVCDFQMSHLPEEYQTRETFTKIKDLCDLTVKILIKYISMDRPDTYADSDEPYPYSDKRMRGSKRIRRFGTGFVRSLDSDGKKSHVQGERCPCADCKKSDSPKMEYWTLLVATSTHVIFDDSEAACAVIECFFDSDDREGVKIMHGVSLKSRSLEFSNHQSDSAILNCVTHDKHLFNKLHGLCCNYNFTFSMDKYASPLAYVISHPHGCCKRISFGKLVHITEPIDSEHPVRTPIMFEDGTVCRLPFYPWSKPDVEDATPSNGTDLSRDSHLHRENQVDPTGFQTNEEKSIEIKSKEEEEEQQQHNASSMKADEGSSKTSREADILLEKDEMKRCADLKPSDQSRLSKEKDPQNLTRDSVTIPDEDLIHSSPPCDDYSHLGAASLSLQEILKLSTVEFDPEQSQNREETTEEEMTRASQQYIGFDELGLHGGEFQPIHVFDFASLFGQDVPPPPPGAFITLSPELEYYLKSSSSDAGATEFCLQPGKEFTIPFGATFTLPSSAKYGKRFASLKPAWFTLPPGSKLTLPNGKDIHLPAEAEFLSDRMSLRFSYATYDMSTCAGSSGAIIHQEGVSMGLPFSVYNFSHFGTMADGYKRSGLQNLFLVL